MEATMERKPDFFDKMYATIKSKAIETKLMLERKRLQSTLSGLVDRANDLNSKGVKKGDGEYMKLWNKACEVINLYAEQHDGVDATQIIEQNVSIRQLREWAEYDQSAELKSKWTLVGLGALGSSVAVGVIAGLTHIGYSITTGVFHSTIHFISIHLPW